MKKSKKKGKKLCRYVYVATSDMKWLWLKELVNVSAYVHLFTYESVQVVFCVFFFCTFYHFYYLFHAGIECRMSESKIIRYFRKWMWFTDNTSVYYELREGYDYVALWLSYCIKVELCGNKTKWFGEEENLVTEISDKRFNNKNLYRVRL